MAELRTQIDDGRGTTGRRRVPNWTWRSSGWRRNGQPPPQPCPIQLLATYSDLRSGLGGVAVARLNGARCEGCHLEIPSAELEGVRRAPEDSLVSCPECLRILVR